MGTIPYPAKTATLIREVDKRVMVSLRDGHSFIGDLRSVDQFANLVLHNAVERIYVGKKYGDVARGLIVIRGENVLLIGDLDPFKELTQPFTEVGADEILQLQEAELESKKHREKLFGMAVKQKKLLENMEIG